MIAKFKNINFKVSDGKDFYLNKNDMGRKVIITDEEVHPTYGKRYKVLGYKEWFEENCFEYIK